MTPAAQEPATVEMIAEDRPWLIWSNRHHFWWRQPLYGYTYDVTQAGLYTDAEADAICNDCKYPQTSESRNIKKLAADVDLGWVGERLAAATARADAAEAKIAKLESKLFAAVLDRDALCQALGFKPGPLTGGRSVILSNAAAIQPEMIKARRRADQAQDDAFMWRASVDDGRHSQQPLLLTVWRQRRALEKRLAILTAERDTAYVAGRRAGIEKAAWVEDADIGHTKGYAIVSPQTGRIIVSSIRRTWWAAMLCWLRDEKLSGRGFRKAGYRLVAVRISTIAQPAAPDAGDSR